MNKKVVISFMDESGDNRVFNDWASAEEYLKTVIALNREFISIQASLILNTRKKV
jgi:hypothetical protein